MINKSPHHNHHRRLLTTKQVVITPMPIFIRTPPNRRACRNLHLWNSQSWNHSRSTKIGRTRTWEVCEAVMFWQNFQSLSKLCLKRRRQFGGSFHVNQQAWKGEFLKVSNSTACAPKRFPYDQFMEIPRFVDTFTERSVSPAFVANGTMVRKNWKSKLYNPSSGGCSWLFTSTTIQGSYMRLFLVSPVAKPRIWPLLQGKHPDRAVVVGLFISMLAQLLNVHLNVNL